jgi:hypothetical protein
MGSCKDNRKNNDDNSRRDLPEQTDPCASAQTDPCASAQTDPTAPGQSPAQSVPGASAAGGG